MANVGVEIEGLRQMIRTLEKAGVAVEDLKEVFSKISEAAAHEMQSHVPSRSGKLRASVKGSRAKNKAVVRAGSARVRYAGPINYGWAKRGIKPANFSGKTDQVMQTKAIEMLEDGLKELLVHYGLDVT